MVMMCSVGHVPLSAHINHRKYARRLKWATSSQQHEYTSTCIYSCAQRADAQADQAAGVRGSRSNQRSVSPTERPHPQKDHITSRVIGRRETERQRPAHRRSRSDEVRDDIFAQNSVWDPMTLDVVISQTHWLVSQVRLARWRESLCLLYVQCCHLSGGGFVFATGVSHHTPPPPRGGLASAN